MTKVWSDRNSWFSSSVTNGSDSFQEHNRRMRAFRIAHPKNWKQWGQRVSEVPAGLLTLVPIALMQGALLASYSPN